MAETVEQWWVSDGWLGQGARRILGPFESRDLALNVRSFMERAEGHHNYFVDSCEAVRSEPADA